jgi:hypothetical protein
MASIRESIVADASAARNRFVEFQAAMNRWELYYFPLIQSDWSQHAEQARHELRTIFDEYVHGYRSDAGRMAGPDVGFPPDHDPQCDLIEKVEAGRSNVTIHVRKQTQFGDRFRHILSLHDGRWMIEKSQIFRDQTGKWERYLL